MKKKKRAARVGFGREDEDDDTQELPPKDPTSPPPNELPFQPVIQTIPTIKEDSNQNNPPIPPQTLPPPISAEILNVVEGIFLFS